MLSTTPSTPEDTPRKSALTRSFTVPTKTATSRIGPSAEIGAAEGIETLYVHPNGKVVKFTTSNSGSRPGSSTGASSPKGGQPTLGVLPWATLTEQTMAAGPVEIYRVPGSVSFLHSGSLLHAILPRSNCWCVDGLSKFAIRVLTDTYYRVELPGDTPEDLEKVEEFKETLKKVLFYERTACPFARTFTVDLPEEPVVRTRRRRTHGPAKKWRLEKAYSWKPEGGGEPLDEGSSGSQTGSDDDDEYEKDDQSEVLETADKPQELSFSSRISSSSPSVRERATGYNLRSVTAPAQLTLQSTPPSRLRTAVLADNSLISIDQRDCDRRPLEAPRSLDPISVRPFHSIPTDMPPSPPDSAAGFEYTEHTPRLAGSQQPQRLVETTASEATTVQAESIAPGSVHVLQSTSERAEHAEPTNIVNTSVAKPGQNSVTLHDQTSFDGNADPDPNKDTTDPFAQIQARIQARRSIGGTMDPLESSRKNSPSSTDSSSSSSLSSARYGMYRRSQQQQHAFTTALVKKACAVFLGPPAHLVIIMLRIAAKYAKGALPRSLLFESPAGMSKRVPGSFDLASSDVEDLDLEEDDAEDWEEDDFGVPLRSPVRLAAAMNEALSRTTSYDDHTASLTQGRQGWSSRAES